MTSRKRIKGDDVTGLVEQGLIELGSSEELKYTRIPFNIPVLDNLLGGGIPKKRITILNGPPNVGKSYLASQLVSSYQKDNPEHTVAWIDTELSWDPDWMTECGINVGNIYVAQPVTGEQAFSTIRTLMDLEFGLIVLDSIAGLVPSSIHEENFDYNPVAWQARFINNSIPRVLPHLKKGCALVCINQLRSGIGPVSMDTMPGGMGQTFFSHMILQVRRNGWIEEDKVKLGFELEVVVRKTKVGSENQAKCSIPFRFDGGIDIVETYIREALNNEVIKQSGPWYQLHNEEKKMGLNGVRNYYIENPEEFEIMKGRL